MSVYAVVTRPFLGLLLYTVLYMWRPGEVYPLLSRLHAERVVGVLALVGMCLRQYHITGRLFLDRSRQTHLLLLVLLASVISVPFAYWRTGAVTALVSFLRLLAWYLLVVHLVDTRLRLRIYLSVYLLAICKIAVDTCRAYVAGDVMLAQGIERAVGQTNAGGDPNSLAATMAATIPILLLLSVNVRRRWLRPLPVLAAVLLVITMALTGSRSGLLGFFAALLVLWWRCRRRLLVAMTGVAILLSGYTLLPLQYRLRYSTIGSSALDSSSRGRLDAWRKGIQMILDRPLTGVGIGCFGTAHALGYSSESRQNWLQAHSLYVQVPAELGLLGAFAFFLFLYEILRLNHMAARYQHSVHPSWHFEQAVLGGLAAGVAALLVAGVFGHSFLRYTWYVYGALGLVVARFGLLSSERLVQ
jgi:probable O-glycosylation ligase (exosortase A-associated)